MSFRTFPGSIFTKHLQCNHKIYFTSGTSGHVIKADLDTVSISGVRKTPLQTGALLNGQVGLQIVPPMTEEDGPWSFPHDSETDTDTFNESRVCTCM